MTVRLGILHMDDLPEHAVHVRGGYPDLYAHLFRDHAVELVHVAVHRGEAPTSLDECDGWVMGGSRHSVGDDFAWIRSGAEIIREAVTAERPFVGICFGHQLMAEALGGRSGPAEVGWGIGAQRYTTLASPGGHDEALAHTTLVASHRDQVLELPAGAEVWSTADYCPIAGMRVGGRAWTVQGHPEFTADVGAVLYEGRRAALGDAEVDEAKRSLATTPLSNDAVATTIVRFVTGS